MVGALKERAGTSAKPGAAITTTEEAAKHVSEALERLSGITGRKYEMPHVKLVNMKPESWQNYGAFACRDSYMTRSSTGEKQIRSGPVLKVRNGAEPIAVYHEAVHYARYAHRVDDVTLENSFARWAVEEMCALVASNLMKPQGVTEPIKDMYGYALFGAVTPRSNMAVLGRMVTAFRAAEAEGVLLDERHIAEIFRSSLRMKKLPEEPGEDGQYVIGMALGVMLLAANGMDAKKTVRDAATLTGSRLLEKAVGSVRSREGLKCIEKLQGELERAFPRTGWSRLESAVERIFGTT
jgi:hypothetical protein